MEKLLVLGAAEGSLGAAIAIAALDFFKVETAGLGSEDHSPFNITVPYDIETLLEYVKPKHIVCTAGINKPYDGVGLADWMWWLEDTYRVNTVGPLSLLNEWHRGGFSYPSGHFVAISSNSAHIARTNSAAYCASKAALSMGVRVAAREMAASGNVVYAYEPGWLDGTPMSKAVTQRLQPLGELGRRPLHRIPGGQGVDPYRLAGLIVRNLRYGGPELNGTTIRVDGGEQ